MKSIFNRISALLLIIFTLAGMPFSAFADSAIKSDAVSTGVEPVPEEIEISLEEALGLTPVEIPVFSTGVTAEMHLSVSESDTLTEAESIIPGTTTGTSNGSDAGTADNAEYEEPEPVEGWDNLVVSEIMDIDTATISNVNLVRVNGYKGPVARITGKLTLDNVLIEGLPASEADLAGHFELVTRASIVIKSNDKLTPSVNAVSLDKSSTKKLGLKWNGKTLKSSSASWKSSNKKIVTVDKNGKIKGVAKGVATVTATYKKKKVAICVVVTNPVTKVTLSPAVKYLNEQTQHQLIAAISPETADYTAITWTSSNEAVATVDQNGLISGLVPGKATITATAVSGKSASMNIQVIRPAVEMTLPEAARVSLKKTKTLKPAFIPEDTSVKTCAWTTSNKKVATVSKKGVVTGVGTGTCVITATSHNGIVSQCTITVVRPVTSLKMSKSSLTLSLNHTDKLKAKISPSNASIKTIAWSSSNPEVVSVDESGNIAGLKKGTATITAKSYNGKTTKCKVTVKEYKPTSLNFTQLYVTMNPGNTFEAKYKIKPSNASNKQILYTSSNPDAATVDENGVVTAVGVGSATITGSCAANTKIKNTFEVCVIEAGSARMAGLTIGINPGHQTKTIFKKYPIAPGSKEKAYGCKVGTAGRWTRVNEYEVVLDVGLKLAEMLTEEGATVVLTRTKNNVSLTNIQRANILNKAGVDVALQLHCNGSSNTKKNGLSAFYRTTGSWVAESKSLAKHLCREISAASGLYNKGTEAYNGYMSLNYSTTPAVLLEMGYMSNKKEDKLLATESFRKKLAYGIKEGLCSYYGR